MKEEKKNLTGDEILGRRKSQALKPIRDGMIEAYRFLEEYLRQKEQKSEPPSKSQSGFKGKPPEA